MWPFSSVTSAGPSAGEAMLPYCLVPAATGAMLPAGVAAGSSTLAKSSSVIFRAGLSSVLAIVSFFILVFCWNFLLRRRGLIQAIRTSAAAKAQNSRMHRIKLPERVHQLLIPYGLLKHG